MDAPWMLKRSISKRRSHKCEAWPDLSRDDVDAIPTVGLDDLHHNMHQAGFEADVSEERRGRARDLEGNRQVEYNYWQQQVEEHQQQLHSHQRRWQMQQQEWLEQSASWDEQQARHRSMRRKSVKKPEKPSWTCLEQLKKTLTVDSAEEEPGPPSQAPSHRSSHPGIAEKKNAPDREHRRRSRHRHQGLSKHSHRSHEGREHHKVRSSDLEQDFKEEAMEFQAGAETTQQLNEQEAIARVTSPRFGRPDSPESQDFTDSLIQRSPVFGSRRGSPTMHREKINFIHPWADGAESFPPSTSTIATAMDSPGRGLRSREHQHRSYLQQAAFSQDFPNRRQERASQHYEAALHNQRGARFQNTSGSFRNAPQKHDEESERQVKWRSDLRQQLDEGLREALSHDLLEFQREAFFGSRGKKAPQPSLQLLEEGVEWSEERVEEDVGEETEPVANVSEAPDEADVVRESHVETEQPATAIEASDVQYVEQERHDETAECAAGGLDAAEEEVESEDPSSQSPDDIIGESEEPKEVQDSNTGDLEEEPPRSDEEELGSQQEERHEEEEMSVCFSIESEGITEEEKTAVNTEISEELLHLDEQPPITAIAEEQAEAEGGEEEAAAEGHGEASEMKETQWDAEATQETRVVEPVEEDTAQIEVNQGEHEPSSAVEAERGTRDTRHPQGIAVTDQLTLEALHALSLGMLRPQPQPTWEHHMGASKLPGDWIVGVPTTGGIGMPASMACGPQHPQLRTGTDMLYSWLAGTARLQQQLLMQSGGIVAAPLPSSELSRDSCASSVSSAVPPDFQWWTPSTEVVAPASSCQEPQQKAVTNASPGAGCHPEGAHDQGKDGTIVLSPPCEDPEQGAEGRAGAEGAHDQGRDGTIALFPPCEDSEQGAEGRAGAEGAHDQVRDGTVVLSPPCEDSEQGAEGRAGAEGAHDQVRDGTIVLSPPCEDSKQGAEGRAGVVSASTDEATQASPEKATASPESRSSVGSHSDEQAECNSPAQLSESENVVSSEEASRSEGGASPPSDSKMADEAPADGVEESQAARGQCVLLLKEEAASPAAAPAVVKREEAAEPGEGTATSGPAHVQSSASADASNPNAASDEFSESSLLSLSLNDLDHFKRLQRSRAERASAKHAQFVARTSPSTSASSTTQAGFQHVQGKQFKREASHTPREALPAPPPARARDYRHQTPAPVASVGADGLHCQQPPILELAERGKDWQAETFNSRQLQQELQDALRQQLRQQQVGQRQHTLQGQPQHFQSAQEKVFLQLKGGQLQQHQKGRERVAESTPCFTPKVRFSDEAVKNEELKEQLRKQAKELRKLRHFRDEQQALHQETERHLDTLHKELQDLAKKNVCLLQEQKQIGLGAQKAAFRLLLLNALQQREVDKQDAAVSPRNEEGATLEHFLKQNKELEQMQWQLQQLRQSVVSSQAGQHRDHQRVLELQESERLLQQENEQLKSTIEAMQQGHAAVVESERLKLEEKRQSTAQLEVEAEEQLRETLEVMQLLKQCLQEQKQRVASLENQLGVLQQQQEQQSSERQLAASTQSAALLDMLAREAASKETQELQSFITSTDPQEGRSDKNLARAPQVETVETAETGIQAGNPMPYSKSIPSEAEQQQQANRHAAQQQALIARLKLALSTQAKAFSKDKAYYQQLVLQLQGRIAELERYQHQLLLHVQQQQHALQTRAGMAAAHYQPLVHQAPSPFNATEAARAAAAAVLQQVATTAAAVQKAAREAADQTHVERREEAKGAAVHKDSPSIPNNDDTEDWLKLLAGAIEDDDHIEGVLATEAQQSNTAASLSTEQQGNNGTPFSTAVGGTENLNLPSVSAAPVREQAGFSFPEHATRGSEQQQTTSVASLTLGIPPAGHASPEVLQEELLRHFQESFGEKIYQHLEKLQQTLNSPRLQSVECQSKRSLQMAPSEDTLTGAGQKLTTSLASHQEQGCSSEDAGVQHSQQESAEQRLFLLLQQHRHSHSSASTPTYVSPVGTVESVQISAAAPAEIELQAKHLKRQDAHRSPVTSTTASSVVADFCTEESSGGLSLALPEINADAKEFDEDLPGARQKVQQFRRMLRQQGLLS
ncbi:hypothetical protein Emag_003943 [Eimeria magna]